MPSSTPQNRSILLIGCGKMGQAMLTAWIENDLIAAATVIDPHLDASDITHDNIHICDDIASIHPDAQFDMMIIAVKPQIMDSVLVKLTQHLNTLPPLLSIAAGKSTFAIAAAIKKDDHPIIRIMPNTPAAIGKGVSVAVANKSTTDNQKGFADTLLRSCGLLEWVEDEELLNAVTALSGSGPAYIFHMIEILEKAGQGVGLPPQLSGILARQTVIGAAALAEHDFKTPASVLRENVTSKEGTTAAALDVLMDGELQKIYDKALTAAKTRGEELDH